MSFNIHLQINSSPKNKLDKTLEDVTTLSGCLKEKTSIIDPVIKIACDLSDIKYANYMTISEFGRSYFITDIQSVHENIVEIYGHVDVLGTYKSQIRANKAIVRKQENVWNLYLNDGSFKVYQNPNVLTKEFPSGFTTQNFVLAVAGS